MTKKFMKETGLDKNSAMVYLRKSNWNYGQAKLLWYMPETLSNFVYEVGKIDWSEKFASLAKAMEESTKTVTEAIKKMYEEIRLKS